MSQIVVIVGGGLSGSLLALKLRRLRPDFRIVLIEQARRAGRGLAYGACGPEHLLNVPVSRMEVGLTPTFGAWLQSRPDAIADLEAALEESGGDLEAAFAPRRLFGEYLNERLEAAITRGPGPGLVTVRESVVRLLAGPRRGVLLADGREIVGDIVVLATGNLPPRPPGGPDGWLYDSSDFVADPWAYDAFSNLAPHEPVLLIGAGLTMVDVALKLREGGHTGPMTAISRHGLVPRTHQGGGAWPAFMAAALPASPLGLFRLVRQQVRAAEAQGVPWQRVFDAARPAVASVWAHWDDRQRGQFLRHLRARWDVHRHRMAPRITAALQSMLDGGQLEIAAARLAGFAVVGTGVEVSLALPGGRRRKVYAEKVVNCTGPRSDLGRLAIPLFADLRERGLAGADPLGLGFETQDCAVLDANGRPSDWLFALGPLTRPAWWEITAAPEINLQAERLAVLLAADQPDDAALRAEAFHDLGAGI